MFRWRLVVGTALIALLVVLCWADHYCPVPGVVLLPLVVVICLLGTAEFLALVKTAGVCCSTWPVYVGNIAILLAAWVPGLVWGSCQQSGPGQSIGTEALSAAHGWLLWTLAGALILLMLEEIRHFTGPGGIVARLGTSSLGLLYVGFLLSFLVLLRMGYGIKALASVVIVVKMADTAAYFVGHLFGRRKLAPQLSPGKTIEGTLGGLLGAWAASWAVFTWLTPALSPCAEPYNPTAAAWWAWTSYGLVLGLVGLGGDLAESLLKRDAGRKDSSQWMPGLGGVLDLMDSLLWSAPVAYLWWHRGWVQ
ncbi:MAG: phosphatidate cytidylyltransferase [Thermoguttaceae bacterium]|nr:phosphatidate cytidylyltransferase [Thermoguttaceae bacterium]MDW8037220.1 phosphatidate cytidylyltransferase [Thermoguttaceae bacterium]